MLIHARALVASLSLDLFFPSSSSLHSNLKFKFSHQNTGHRGRQALSLSLPQIDPERVGITGHSRNGKQSLIAAAFDERFKAVVCNYVSLSI